ncbi:MAG: hypothetical protein BMS9Abin05_0063 [Rhodothermia bacterium]|nr:MAG: hypothetical protein BMS9Abin05_0063 [Rhodothermia bacterium]
MTPNREGGFLEDLLYFNALVLWDCVPEETSFQLYDSFWTEYKAYSSLDFSGEQERLSTKIDGILARVSVLDIVIPLFDTTSSRSVIEKPLATLKGAVVKIDGLRMVYEEKKSLTSVFLVVPPGVTDGKAFSAAVNRKKDALQRLRRHQFELYYRYDMRNRALKLARICRETLPMFPDFKSVARFDRRVSDEGGRPRNWYQEVSRIGLAVSYFSSNRQDRGIGDLQDFIAENNREPVPRHAVGEDLKRTCRKWGVSLLTEMGIDGYKSAVGSVWTNMEGSPDPQIRRAVDRFKSEQKEQRSKK